MNKIITVFIFLYCQINYSQELFVVTDPASNIPTNTLNVHFMQSVFKEKFIDGYNYHLMPEVSYGIHKKIMVRTSIFVSNISNQFVVEGGSLYTKYRFYSTDDLNTHFRLAAFGRYSFNNSDNHPDIHTEQIEIMTHNSGYEGGIIATKLIKKVAISSSVSFEKVIDNRFNSFPIYYGRDATNYTLSIGKLIYPRKYTSLKQTNINLILEFVGQSINQKDKSYLDIVPAVQFIINSQARIDFAYRQEILSSMLRTSPNGFYLNLEYNFFNSF